MNFSLKSVASLLFLSLLSPFAQCHANYNKNVIKLTGANFNELVLKNERPVMVKFYAAYCGHCKQMIPAYDSLATNLRELVDIAAIDCAISSNAATCGKYNIEGYPTLKFFMIQEVDGKKKKVVLNYEDGRTTNDMTAFIKKKMHNFIFKVGQTVPKSGQQSKWTVNFETFFSKGGNIPKLLLFRSNTKEAPTMLFRALSIKYHYKIAVGDVSIALDSEFAAKFNLPKGKVGLVYFSEGSENGKTVLYDGKVTREDIFAFLDKQLALSVQEKTEL